MKVKLDTKLAIFDTFKTKGNELTGEANRQRAIITILASNANPAERTRTGISQRIAEKQGIARGTTIGPRSEEENADAGRGRQDRLHHRRCERDGPWHGEGIRRGGHADHAGGHRCPGPGAGGSRSQEGRGHGLEHRL